MKNKLGKRDLEKKIRLRVIFYPKLPFLRTCQVETDQSYRQKIKILNLQMNLSRKLNLTKFKALKETLSRVKIKFLR
jgi:hypothetical protein